ncbi:hypothetical protein GQ42DRAFT_161799 [Ramicandelaber brevisporus]|nr:hypothetical protein GQ42DRAFT_161799 [Ramicandelaber brevisporus]
MASQQVRNKFMEAIARRAELKAQAQARYGHLLDSPAQVAVKHILAKYGPAHRHQIFQRIQSDKPKYAALSEVTTTHLKRTILQGLHEKGEVCKILLRNKDDLKFGTTARFRLGMPWPTTMEEMNKYGRDWKVEPHWKLPLGQDLTKVLGRTVGWTRPLKEKEIEGGKGATVAPQPENVLKPEWTEEYFEKWAEMMVEECAIGKKTYQKQHKMAWVFDIHPELSKIYESEDVLHPEWALSGSNPISKAVLAMQGVRAEQKDKFWTP